MFIYASIEETVDDEEVETELRIEFDTEPYVPARIYGPPELCYPDSGGEVNILEIWALAPGGDPYTKHSWHRRADLMDSQSSNPKRWAEWEYVCSSEAIDHPDVPDFDGA